MTFLSLHQDCDNFAKNCYASIKKQSFEFRTTRQYVLMSVLLAHRGDGMDEEVVHKPRITEFPIRGLNGE